MSVGGAQVPAEEEDGAAMSDCTERERVCYEQNFEQFRSLNAIMWQVPVIAMTLTGGLWFGTANISSMPGFQYLLLVLAAMANVGFIVVLTRIRFVIGCYLDALSKFNPKHHVAAEGKWFCSPETVATTFRLLLGVSALISVVGMRMVHNASGVDTHGRRVIEVIELDK